MTRAGALDVVLRRAGADDAARLTDFAARVFRDTFGPDNRPEDMAAYAASAFTAARQHEEITDPRAVVLLAEANGGDALAGYAHLLRGDAPACVPGAPAIALERFYVGHEWHGRGVAHALMDEVLDEAARAGAAVLWLGVWERNPRAIAFYERRGFAVVGEQRFVLGADVQNDLVMARPLVSSPA